MVKISPSKDLAIFRICMMENWTKRLATGKVILCFSNIGPVPLSGIAQVAVKTANGSGLIFVEPPTNQIADIDIIPTVRVDISQGTQILNYLAQLPK